MKVRYQGILDYVHNEMSLHLAEELIAILELNPDLAILPLTYNPVLDELKAKIGATYGDADETTEGVIELAKVQATKNILKKLQGPVYLDYFGKEGLKGMDPIETSEIDDTWRFSTMLEGVSVDYVYPKAKDDPQIKLQIVKV